MRIGFPNIMKTRAALPLAGLLLLVVCANLAQAEDWFVKGRVYNNVQVTKVNPDSVSVRPSHRQSRPEWHVDERHVR